MSSEDLSEAFKIYEPLKTCLKNLRCDSPEKCEARARSEKMKWKSVSWPQVAAGTPSLIALNGCKNRPSIINNSSKMLEPQE